MKETQHVLRALRVHLWLASLVALVAVFGLAGSASAQKPKGAHPPAPKHEPPPEPPLPLIAPEPEPAKEEPEPEGQSMALVVFLEKLTKFDLGPGVYNGEYYLVFHCEKEPCKPDPHPTNGRFASREQEKSSDPLVKIFKVKAELEAVIDLSEFPFDSHVLPLSVEDKNEAVTYHFDPALNSAYLDAMGISSTVSPEAKLSGWTVAKDMRAPVVKQKIGAMVELELLERAGELLDRHDGTPLRASRLRDVRAPGHASGGEATNEQLRRHGPHVRPFRLIHDPLVHLLGLPQPWSVPTPEERGDRSR